jgi:alpha-tubulin suppressor-like RCC1 family protein
MITRFLHNRVWRPLSNRQKIVSSSAFGLCLVAGLTWFFMNSTSAIVEGDGLMFYAASANTNPQTRAYSTPDSFATANGTVNGTQPISTVIKTSPTKQEAIAGYINASGVLQIMCYDGTTWSNEWTVTVGGTGTTQRFDIEYEKTSGNAMVLYGNNGATLGYRTKASSSNCGGANWAAATTFTPTRTAAAIAWVKLAQNKTSGSNLIAAAWGDTGSDLSSRIWSGSAWGGEHTAALSATLEVATAAQDVDSFDIEYETSSGDLMVVWGNLGSAAVNLIGYATCTGNTSTCTWTTGLIPTVADAATNIDLGVNPATDEMSMAAVDNGSGDLSGAYWSGSLWTGYANLDAQVEVPAAGMKLVATGWVVNGSVTRYIIVFDDNAGTTLQRFVATPGVTPTNPGDVTVTPVINDVRGRYDIQNNPFNNAELMHTVTDSTNALSAKRMTVDSSGLYTWTNANGAASLGALTANTAPTFSFSYWRYIPVASLAQVKYRWFENSHTTQLGENYTKLLDPSSLPSDSTSGTAWSPNETYLSATSVNTPFLHIYKRSGDTFTKLANPASLPTSVGRETAWSPDSTYLAMTSSTTPFIHIYKRSGDTFTKLANPGTLPPSDSTGVSWSPDGTYLSVPSTTTPFVTIYKRSGDTFTKLSNPATLPAGAGNDTEWSSDGIYMTVAHAVTPYVTIYKRSGDTFTKLANPATLSGSQCYSASWSADMTYLTLGCFTTPFMITYKRSGDTFTKLSDPLTLPAGAAYSMDWSEDGRYVIVTHDTSPYMSMYSRSGDTFTKISNPSSLPTGAVWSSAWSPGDKYLALGMGSAPYLQIYKSPLHVGVGSSLAAADTPAAAPAAGIPFRLRLNLAVSDTELTSIPQFKLRYQQKSGSCSTNPSAYNDVTADSDIRFYNGLLDDGAGMLSSPDDPTRTSITNNLQSYEESNTFGALTSIANGTDGIWDFTLTADYDANGTYCFLVTKSDDTALASYTSIPEITANINEVLGQKDFRLYQNADSLTPGTPLANNNTSTSLSNDNFRLRSTLGISMKFKELSSSGSGCGVTTEERVYCWGSNFYGQLGNGNTGTDSNIPVAVSTSGVLSGKAVLSVSTSGGLACAIASDEKVYCWGDNPYGQLGNGNTGTDSNVPVAVSTSGVLSGKTIKSVSVSSGRACVIASDNQVYCWGGNADGQLGNGNTGTDSNVPVAVSTSGVLSGKTIKSLKVGFSHTCVIASDDQAYCWGDNAHGQLGNGNTGTDSNIPVAVSTSGVLSGKTITQIAAQGSSTLPTGTANTCVIASDDQAYCWGDNGYSQLGNGNTGTDSNVPVAVSTTGVLSGKTVNYIDIGTRHACLIASDNQAYCWGDNPEGRLGNGNTGTDSNVPVPVTNSGVLSGKTILSISPGANTACALASDFQIYCWGGNTDGQLGNGNTGTDSNVPIAVFSSNILAGKSILSISAGVSHTCAIASDNQAYCWGDDSDGQLGNGATTGTQVSPVAVDTTGVLSGKTILSISTGYNHTCAIASDNKAYCWGSDIGLGDGATVANQDSPVAVDTSGVLAGKSILKIDNGFTHTCAIASDNQAYCWGDDSDGQLGNGATTGTQVSPVAVDTTGVLSGKTILSITAGYSHTCVIASDNQAYCWGIDGGLGNGATTGTQVSPVAVDTTGVLSGKTILRITAGSFFTCAIASDNQAYCWGTDFSGQIGNGATTGDPVSPVAVDTTGVLAGKTILKIDSGYNHTCAIASDNQAYCWGSDEYGQIGNGANTGNQVSPVAVVTSGVLAGKTILSISAATGYSSPPTGHTCAIASDNLAYCWGRNFDGQIGNGITATAEVNPDDVLMPGDLGAVSIGSNALSLKLQYAAKGSAGSCSAVTAYADITTSSAISYADNASVANALAISTHANDPIASTSTIAITYHETNSAAITNPSAIAVGKYAMWDYSLRDLSAPDNTTYCLRMTGTDDSILGSYTYFAEFTTGVSVPSGPNLDQMVRGGQAVVDGVKSLFSW